MYAKKNGATSFLFLMGPKIRQYSVSLEMWIQIVCFPNKWQIINLSLYSKNVLMPFNTNLVSNEEKRDIYAVYESQK